jgi:hypothetical protein
VDVSTRNRERRKLKQKTADQKARRRADRIVGSGHPGNPFEGLTPREIAEMAVQHATQAICAGDDGALDTMLTTLSGQTLVPHWRTHVSMALLISMQSDVVGAWRRGWQPADLVRLAQRQLSAHHARILLDVIAAEMRKYASGTVDARWAAQLTSLGAGEWWSADHALIDEWEVRAGMDRAGVLRCALELRRLLLTRAGDIGRLCPLPGEARRGSLDPRGIGPYAGDQRMLDRVRALLTKAESTEFGEEAEALTAKAQELMARHSIDYALLSAHSGVRDEPGGCRIGIDAPYESSKTLLLQMVAEANRCRAIWHKAPGFTTVVGFAVDLEAVELVYTSLLVQASRAMQQEGSRRDPYGRSRTRSFRQAFLDAFAIRIGQRLRTATTEASLDMATESGSANLLPVLAARTDVVEEAMAKMFPEAGMTAVTVNNREGWIAGRAAADLATLHASQAVGAGVE